MSRKFLVPFHLVLVLLAFLFESAGFVSGLAFSLVLAIFFVSDEFCAASTAFFGGFLLDLVSMRPFGLNSVVFLAFLLVSLLLSSFTVSRSWFRVALMTLFSVAYNLFLVLPSLVDLNLRFLLLSIFVNFLLAMVFYFLLSLLRRQFFDQPDLQLQLEV